MGEEAESHIVSKLHQILKPREYLLYAPLSQEQQELYDAIIQRRIREYILQRKLSTLNQQETDDTNTLRSKHGRKLTPNDYDENIDDDEYIMRLEREHDTLDQQKRQLDAERKHDAGKYHYFFII
jgi:ATP-dependent DNA helicase